MEVQVKENETVETALKRFRKKCQRAGLFSEMKKRARYTKPSEERQIAAQKAQRKHEKRMRKQRRSRRLW